MSPEKPSLASGRELHTVNNVRPPRERLESRRFASPNFQVAMDFFKELQAVGDTSPDITEIVWNIFNEVIGQLKTVEGIYGKMKIRWVVELLQHFCFSVHKTPTIRWGVVENIPPTRFIRDIF